MGEQKGEMSEQSIQLVNRIKPLQQKTYCLSSRILYKFEILSFIYPSELSSMKSAKSCLNASVSYPSTPKKFSNLSAASFLEIFNVSGALCRSSLSTASKNVFSVQQKTMYKYVFVAYTES